MEVAEGLDLMDPEAVAPDGESRNQFVRRIINFLQELAKKDHERVLLVTHEGVLRAILSEFYSVGFNSKQTKSAQGVVYRMEMEEGEMKAISQVN